MKPFEIQSPALSINGVLIDTSAQGKLVIPGVTRAGTSVAIEVDDTDDQTTEWTGTPVVIDGYTYYTAIQGNSPINGWTAATYEVDEIDDDGFIDEINVVTGGAGYTGEAVTYSQTMYAAPENTLIDPSTINDWVEIPFKVRCGAGEIESELGGSGGASALEQLEDVDLSDPTNGQALVWDSNDEVWKNQTISGGSGDLGSFIFDSNTISVESGADIYIETNETGGPGESRLVLKPQDDDGGDNPTRLEGSYGVGIWTNTTDTEKKWLFGTDGSLTFPDNTVQTTAYTGQSGGVTVTTDLWIAAGTSPGGAAVVSSTNGVDWTTSDYLMEGLTIEKVAIGPDRIVYIITGLPNGASSGLYHTGAPENTPVLATGTDFYGMGFPLEWRELNYLGGKFVAVGSYIVGQTISTDITSLTLAAGDRPTCQLTITNTTWDYDGQLITITGATNTELNGTWRLVYNSLDTLETGIYDILTQDWQPTSFTSTDLSGAVITDFDGDSTFPMYAYSTDGISWTYGTVDGEYITTVLGETPVAAMADVAYNGTGYLIPVVDNKFSYGDDPYASGPGTFYITDLAGGANEPQFIPGGGPNSLPGKYNNIAAYADGTFFVSDDQYTVWTNADPTNDPWVDHNMQSALTTHFGYSVGNGPGENNSEIYESVAGTVGGEQMFVATIDDGAVVWTTDNGTTWNVVTVAPTVLSVPLSAQGTITSLDFDGIDTPSDWEKITIQVSGNDDVRWNGTYYAYNNTPDNIYKLYDGVEGNAIDSTGWTTPTTPLTVTLSQGNSLSKLHIADDTCIVFSGDTENKLYRSTNMTTWTSVFTNDAYGINDIYYATRTATATNRLDYTDERTGYNSTAVLTYDFDVDVDNAHLNINGDGSWEIGSENFDTMIYSAGPEEPTNIIVQANNRYWTFNDAGGFRFPDDTVQTTAFVNRNINVDGGGAAVHFEQEVGFVDGGFSATRHGVADPVFNGGDRLTEDNQFNLNGGGA